MMMKPVLVFPEASDNIDDDDDEGEEEE